MSPALSLLVSGLAGALALVLAARLLPSLWGGLGTVALVVVSGIGPWLLGAHGVRAGYLGAGAAFVALLAFQSYSLAVAMVDVRLREIVRGQPRRIPPL